METYVRLCLLIKIAVSAMVYVLKPKKKISTMSMWMANINMVKLMVVHVYKSVIYFILNSSTGSQFNILRYAVLALRPFN